MELDRLPQHLSIYILLLAVGVIFLQRKSPSNKLRQKQLPCCKKDISQHKLLSGLQISAENRAKYGLIYKQKSGFQYEVVLTNPDQLKQYFGSNAKDHRKLDSFGAGKYLVALLGDCLGFQNGDLWTRMRKLFNVHFTHAMAVKTLPAMIEFVGNWRPKHKLTIEVDPFAFVSEIPFTCVAQYLYGEKPCSGQILQDLKNLIPLHSKLMAFAFSTTIGRYKFFQYFPFKKMQELKYFQQHFEELSLNMVEQAQKLGINTVASDLYELVKTGELTQNNWIQTLDEILFANIDVTATVMAWSLVELGKNDNEQKLLRQEIAEVGDPEKFCKRTDTYLHRVLLEILRLHPLLWYSFPEISPHDMVIDGFKIKANTPIVIDQYQLNYNSPIWRSTNITDFGSSFHPDRFEALQNRDINLSNVTFGCGPRRCLGKNFAELLIKTEIFTVLKHFEVSLCQEVKIAKDTFVVQPDTKIKLKAI